jgi:DNA-damage-inducible protein D
MNDMSVVVRKALDDAKQFTEGGAEFWRARDLQTILGYAKWANFTSVIEKARFGCESLGIDSSHHFAATGKMVGIGSGAEVMKQDYFLSRYACYLIAMNGETSKPEIAFAQTYFAIQTLRQEAFDQLPEDERRIRLRDHVRKSNRVLQGVAKAAGVVRFDVFNDAGYRGLYNAGVSTIKATKGIDTKEELLDCVGSAELAANHFRITQTEQKLKEDKIKGQDPASNAHFAVGRKVRQTMMEISNKAPERLPREENIKKIEARKRKAILSAARKARRR